jgi:hypothetical protein
MRRSTHFAVDAPPRALVRSSASRDAMAALPASANDLMAITPALKREMAADGAQRGGKRHLAGRLRSALGGGA